MEGLLSTGPTPSSLHTLSYFFNILLFFSLIRIFCTFVYNSIFSCFFYFFSLKRSDNFKYFCTTLQNACHFMRLVAWQFALNFLFSFCWASTLVNWIIFHFWYCCSSKFTCFCEWLSNPYQPPKVNPLNFGRT